MGTEYILTTNGELYHWGVKGMKWGVRRYQNKDGSLTAAGKKRRAKLEAELDKLGTGKKSSTDTDTRARKKSVSEMSNKELQEYTTRMQLEKSYYDAKRSLDSANPKQVSKGQKFAEKFLNDAVIPAISNSTKAYLESYMKKTLGISSEDTLSALKKTYETLDYQQRIDKLKNPDKYMSWDDRLKKRNYDDETKKRADAEKAAADKEKASKQKENNKSNPADTEPANNSNKNSGGVKGEKWERRSSEKTKVYEGEVVGNGTSGEKRKTQNTSKKETVIDAEWADIEVSNVPAVTTNRGRSYISGLLESPKEWDD